MTWSRLNDGYGSYSMLYELFSFCLLSVRRIAVLYLLYVTFPSQSANSGLPLLCAAHRSHSSGPSVREREGVRPSLLLLPSPPLPLSPNSPTLPTASTLFAHTTQVLHILSPKLYPASAGPDPRHNHHHYSSHLFFSLSTALIL